MLEILRPCGLQQSRTVLAIVRENSLKLVMAGQPEGRDPAIQLTYAAAPLAPTEASAIFTPGPMVELREIFFI